MIGDFLVTGSVGRVAIVIVAFRFELLAGFPGLIAILEDDCLKQTVVVQNLALGFDLRGCSIAIGLGS